MPLEKVLTIGVFGSNENEFFAKLKDNNVDLFVDIRQRRAVRGSKYSFVNSSKLQSKLSSLNINYIHFLTLAPTTQIRELQKRDDLEKGILKSERKELGSVFIDSYKHEVLDNFDFANLFATIETVNASTIVLFCVEKYPKACHRSIVSERMQKEFSIPTQHI